MSSYEQAIEANYDKARGLGIDALKVLLSTSIVIAGVPIVFYGNVTKLFPAAALPWIFTSWIYILISIGTGFLTLFFLFEGYFHQAIQEEFRHTGDQIQTTSYWRIKNHLFDFGHWLGVTSAISFVFALACVAWVICQIRY